jgi:hypothetical protein
MNRLAVPTSPNLELFAYKGSNITRERKKCRFIIWIDVMMTNHAFKALLICMNLFRLQLHENLPKPHPSEKLEFSKKHIIVNEWVQRMKQGCSKHNAPSVASL